MVNMELDSIFRQKFRFLWASNIAIHDDANKYKIAKVEPNYISENLKCPRYSCTPTALF